MVAFYGASMLILLRPMFMCYLMQASMNSVNLILILTKPGRTDYFQARESYTEPSESQIL